MNRLYDTISLHLIPTSRLLGSVFHFGLFIREGALNLGVALLGLGTGFWLRIGVGLWVSGRVSGSVVCN